MYKNKYIHTFLIFFSLVSCGSVQSEPIKVPADNKQRLVIDNLNLSGADFMAAYMSENVSQRRLAEMYLIGVLDSTEGNTWCGFGIVLPGALQEQIFIGLKQQTKEVMQGKAPEVISSLLSKKLPCKDK